jgi:cytidylate kinase
MTHSPVRLAFAVAPPGESRQREFSAVSNTGVNSVVVAMDGPSGSGKSSTARGVATRLGLRYLDTGAQFRAVTDWMLDQGVDLDDPSAIAARVREPELVSGTDPQNPTITIDGKDVAEAIRTQRVTDHVSAVASVPQVRQWLLELQRSIIGDGGIVVEGRDIGSVVAPDAEVKVFLTADPSARAQRRTAENGAGTVEATQADLLRRDAIDSGRTAAPLLMADGAIHLDTTPYSLDEVVDLVVDIVDQAVGATSGPASSGSTG